jgi:hypothetical protein
MAYQGMGRGDYRLKTQYEYVGHGAGEFTPQMVSPQQNVHVYCCVGFGCVILLLLFPFLWYGLTSITMVPPDYPPEPSSSYPHRQGHHPSYPHHPAQPTGPGQCLIWGDPHIKPFDLPNVNHGLPVTFLQNGDYWLVKSHNVWIQGRFEATVWKNGLSALHGIAVGGPFMHHHHIIVGPKSGKVYYNNQQILTESPDTFAVPHIFHASYKTKIVHLGDGSHKHVFYVELDLPEGVRIVVNRWPDHIDAEILMHPVPGQDGYCGNFNGNGKDDTKVQIEQRLPGQVPSELLTFPPTVFMTETPKPYSMKDCES